MGFNRGFNHALNSSPPRSLPGPPGILTPQGGMDGALTASPRPGVQHGKLENPLPSGDVKIAIENGHRNS